MGHSEKTWLAVREWSLKFELRSVLNIDAGRDVKKVVVSTSIWVLGERPIPWPKRTADGLQPSQPEYQRSYSRRLVVTRNIFSMNTIFLATVSIVGVALFCLDQAQSQPPAPGSASESHTTEQATRPQASGGGHGQVRVNTELGVYHREGSPFYGATAKGKYMTEQDAIQAGYKPAPKTR
jgi:hypothetical protein